MVKHRSIKTRLIIIPLIVVFLGVAGIGSVSTYFTRQSLLEEMKREGLGLRLS